MFHGDICTVGLSIITWGLDKYGHSNDVILNWHQAKGGATHTCAILIIAHVPMLFYVKKQKNRADCMNGKYACVLWPGPGGRFNQKKWIIRLFFSRILVVVCGGLWWFAVVCGGLWLFAVVCLLVIPVKE